MKMTSVHCSKVATVYEEEEATIAGERDGTRDYTLFVPHPAMIRP